jgi:hypothetical protein
MNTANGRAPFCMLHPDFHTPGDVTVGAAYDADAYVARLRACGADAARKAAFS